MLDMHIQEVNSMTRKVLIADDEESLVSLLLTTLGTDERYRILVARDGNEALAIASREKPYCVLLDILMPEVDGFTVCQVLKSDPATAGIKIIMLTAMAQEKDRQRAMEVGADDYLTKPFSPTRLLQTLENMLGGPD